MPRDAAVRGHADKTDMAEFFAFMRVRQMHLDHWHCDRFDRIVQRNRRVCVGPRIEQNRLRAHRMRLVQPINQMALMVGLAEINVETQGLRLIVQPTGDIVKRIGPVNLWLARAQKIEIRSVEDENDGAISQYILTVKLALDARATLYGAYPKGETK
jgi:hypothetical protein